jgi:glycosyltransferase involved in cell wall biosynthesis
MCQEPSAFIHSDRWLRALPKSPAGIAARVLNPILKPLDRHFASAVDYVFANSEFSRQLAFDAYGYAPQKVGLSYPGVDLERFKLDSSITRIPHQFITCARLTKFKNVDRVLQAFSRLEATNATLLVIGDGEEYHNLCALSENLGLRNRVSFRRTVSDPEMVRALQSSAALVHAAEGEPFGLAPIEAMACGTPVIAIRGGGPAETVLHEQTGYLCRSAEVEELLPGMQWILSIAQYPYDIAAACQARAQHFTWTKAVDSLETVFGLAQ